MTTRRQPHPPTSTEMEWLCACVSPDPAVYFSRESFSRRSVDWGRFWALATNHHVIPLAYRALKGAARQNGVAIPEEYRSCLQRQYLSISAHNLRATAVLRRLQGLLESKGIRLVPIKGPALAVLAHGSTSLRQFEDLDLMVRGEDLLRAVDLLAGAGYLPREIPATASRVRYLASLQDWSLQKPEDLLHLDLKPVLISHALCGPASADYMAANCRPLDLGEGLSLSAPGPEAMLLAVCVDGANEMWAKLSSIADVGALVAAWPGADWQGLLADAARFGQKRSLLVGVAVANLLLASPMPEAFREAARMDPSVQRLAAQAVRRMRAGISLKTGTWRQNRFAFQTRERMRDRWRFAMRVVFVPGAMDLHQVTLPELCYPFYSILRPFRLAWMAWRGGNRRITLAGGKAKA